MKRPLNICMLRGLLCTRSRDRTGTASLPLVFETSASTNSAIRADLNVLQSEGLMVSYLTLQSAKIE
jgi:hypothetical protein